MSAPDFAIDAEPLPRDLADLTDDLPDELLTQEDRDARAAAATAADEAAKAAAAAEQQAQLQKFGNFVKAIEGLNLNPQPAAAPAPPPAPPPQLTKEQQEELNNQLRTLSIENPALYQTLMEQRASQLAYARIAEEAAPLIDSTAEAFIDRFKTRKAGESPYFKGIEKHFDEELKEYTPRELAMLKPEARQRIMDRAWRAAAGSYFEANAKPVQHLPTSASRGTSVAPSSPRGGRTKVVELSEGEKLAIVRSCKGDKQKAARQIAEIEYGMA